MVAQSGKDTSFMESRGSLLPCQEPDTDLNLETNSVYTSVSQPFSIEEPLRFISISRGTPTCENVYRPQKVDSGERKSITARLLSEKFYVKICCIIYIYICIPRFLEEPQGSWEPWLGNTGLHTHSVFKQHYNCIVSSKTYFI
jgi:hypothetical protein